jgi:hypothetical protein
MPQALRHQLLLNVRKGLLLHKRQLKAVRALVLFCCWPSSVGCLELGAIQKFPNEGFDYAQPDSK